MSSCGSAAPAVAWARVAVRTDHGRTTPETERWRTGRGGTGGRGERFREGRGCPKPFPLRTDGPGPTHVCVPTAERRYKQEACGARVVWPCAWTSAYGSVCGHPAGRRHREGPGRAGVPVSDHHTVPESPCRITTPSRVPVLDHHREAGAAPAVAGSTLCCVTSGEGPADLRVLTFPCGQGQPWASQALLRDHMVLIQMQNFWKEMSFKL